MNVNVNLTLYITIFQIVVCYLTVIANMVHT